MAGLLALRVIVPLSPSREGSQWHVTGHSPLTVAGAAVELGPDLGRPHHIPICSPLLGRFDGEPCMSLLHRETRQGQDGMRQKGAAGRRGGVEP